MEFRKEIPIPSFIDDYNHHMNGVDRSDQRRKVYDIQRRNLKTWKPLWCYLLGLTMANCFILVSRPPPDQTPLYDDYQDFLDDIIDGLFEHSEKTSLPKTSTIDRNRHQRQPAPLSSFSRGSSHTRGKIGQVAKPCRSCAAAGRRATKGTQRKSFDDLSSRTIRGISKAKVGRQQPTPRSRFGCINCNLHLCLVDICWDEHVAASPRHSIDRLDSDAVDETMDVSDPDNETWKLESDDGDRIDPNLSDIPAAISAGMDELYASSMEHQTFYF